MEGRGRPSFYDMSQGDRSPKMVKRTSRGSDMPYPDRRAIQELERGWELLLAPSPTCLLLGRQCTIPLGRRMMEVRL